MGMLDEGADMLADELTGATAIQVTYINKWRSTSLKATRGKSSYDVVDTQGFMTRIEMDDFLIASADIAFDSDPYEKDHEPHEGDLIRLTNQYGLFETYKVQPPSPNLNHYQKLDPGGVMLRVHTKLTDQLPYNF